MQRGRCVTDKSLQGDRSAGTSPSRAQWDILDSRFLSLDFAQSTAPAADSAAAADDSAAATEDSAAALFSFLHSFHISLCLSISLPRFLSLSLNTSLSLSRTLSLTGTLSLALSLI